PYILNRAHGRLDRRPVQPDDSGLNVPLRFLATETAAFAVQCLAPQLQSHPDLRSHPGVEAVARDQRFLFCTPLFPNLDFTKAGKGAPLGIKDAIPVGVASDCGVRPAV